MAEMGGGPGFQGRQVIFNARCESAMEKPLFCDSMRHSRVVILTTRANASMEPVHDRMPLILEENEIAPWILNGERARDILHKTPCLLERRTEYEQLSLF